MCLVGVFLFYYYFFLFLLLFLNVVYITWRLRPCCAYQPAISWSRLTLGKCFVVVFFCFGLFSHIMYVCTAKTDARPFHQRPELEPLPVDQRPIQCVHKRQVSLLISFTANLLHDTTVGLLAGWLMLLLLGFSNGGIHEYVVGDIFMASTKIFD